MGERLAAEWEEEEVMHDVAQLELDDASTFQEASQEALQSRRIV